MKHTSEVLQDWINAIYDRGIALSNWETQFIDFLQERLEVRLAVRGSLSEPEQQILKRIHAEKTP